MNKLKKLAGMTLLELIIVIIIIGVLVSLAFTRFMSMIEFSRSNEALTSLFEIRRAMDRCYLSAGGTFDPLPSPCDFASLDIEDPTNSPGTHFTYSITDQTSTGFVAVATRNAVNGGDGISTVEITTSPTTVTKSGTGAFVGIQP